MTSFTLNVTPTIQHPTFTELLRKRHKTTSYFNSLGLNLDLVEVISRYLPETSVSGSKIHPSRIVDTVPSTATSLNTKAKLSKIELSHVICIVAS